MSYVPIIAASNAAAARRRLRAEREEEMTTGYSRDDLIDEWEFKIVRADTPVFRRPEVMEQVIEQEAMSGWILLEKLDDHRIRFKRPQRARQQDAYLPEGVDPYRTHYGGSGQTVGLMILVLIGIALALVAAAGILPLVLYLR